MTAERRACRMAKEHLAGTAELETLCFSEPWSVSALEMLLTAPGIGFAVPGGEGEPSVLAYGGMMLAGDAQVTNVAVHPEYRRQGLGRLVTETMLCEAKRAGMEGFSLEVRASNQAAIALYRSLGLAEVGRRPHFYSHPVEDALLFACKF